ncbi:hypothetical protein [Mucilaginibacter paludis]|uniref:Lipoprotein n=1 Tax=Mucilaginibacter paludis DSM 18603 TaxID=714943 RepID=H1YGN5_9SPHI|nr:hypothetical protein [Mucilaginibacter paludis]EHQ25421.1 hypothetical protein Mucpa_1257 [Mucilaginibacter paludis DSM 18603]
MKKLYYLFALIAVTFASCDPLSQTYKALDATPKTTAAATYTTTLGTYKSATDANTSIPASLLSKYPSASDGSSALVTFSLAPSSSNVAVPDSTLSRVSVTLATADYSFPASTLPNGTAVPGNSTAYLTSDGVINYLNYKYPTPAANQLVVLTYTYYEAGNTPSSGSTVTDSFLYFASGWIKAYTITPAQYTAAGRGANGYFSATDYAALSGFFNAFLRGDAAVMGPAKTGDVKYVSYKFTATYQKIMTLTYDGSNWVLKQTLQFLKIAGVWAPDPTVYITFPVVKNVTYAYLNNPANANIGTADARANVISFGDFSISGSGTTVWNDTDLTAALAAGLVEKIAKPVVGVPYTVTYYVYVSPSVVPRTKTFVYDGTNFVYQGH